MNLTFILKIFLFSLVSLLLSMNTFAAITFISSVTNSGASNNGASLIVPADTQAGDMLVAQIVIGRGVTAVSQSTGWSLIGGVEQLGNVQQSLYYKIATASDIGTSYSWSFSGTGFFNDSRPYIFGMSVFRGVDNVTPVADNNSANGSVPNNRKIDAPSVITTKPDSYLFAAYAVDLENRSFTADSSMLERYDLEEEYASFFTTSGLTVMSSTELDQGIGATGDREARVNIRNGNFVSHLVALNTDTSTLEINTVVTTCTNFSTINIQFSKELESITAENINNYTLINAGLNSIAITGASLSSDTVTLTLAEAMNDLTPYTIIVNNVEDLDGNSIASNSSDDFILSCGINCITDNFVGPGDLSDSWTVGNSSGSFGNPTIISNGRLRLTDASDDVSTFATLLNQFPGAENRIEIEFDYYGYGGDGADGISVNFSDAAITPRAGAFGGSLGYAQKTGINGFAGGWLGVGLDEYGNFSTGGEGREGGSSNSRIIDSISLRGSGSGTSGYPFLTGTSSLIPGIDQSDNNPDPGHRYKIVIDHTSGGGIATVIVQRDITGTGSSYQTVIPQFNIYDLNTNQAVVPENWVVSFTGSTGGSNNIHEIGDLKVCAAQPIQTFTSVDHYEISHASVGLTCEGSEVIITAHDVNHDVINVLNDTSIGITTTPMVTGIISSPVTILAGTSTTNFYLQQISTLANIDIDLSDGSFTDDEGTNEDPRISFFDTAFRFYVDSSNTDAVPINTQISGKPSTTLPDNQDLTLRAIRTDTDTGACEAGLVGPQTVSLAYTCIDPVDCSTTRLSVTADETKAIIGSDDEASFIYTSLNMEFNENGSAPFNFTFLDAGKIQLHANLNVAESLPDPAFTLIGSSNEFVVRPFAFDLGFTGNYQATSANDFRFVSAGTEFPITIRGVNWQAADDINNDGIPDAGSDVTNNSSTPNFGQEQSAQALTIESYLKLPDPSVGAPGVLSSSAVKTSVSEGYFTAGITDGDPAVNVSWSEVGIIDINVSLDDYLQAAGANIAGIQTNVGRFYPASFSLISSALSNSCTPANGDFSYMDQSEINISYDLEARNAAGIKTLNYDGGFAKATLSLVAENNNEGTNYQSRLSGFNATSWSNGNYIYLDDGVFDRLVSGTPDGPYQDLNIGIQLADNDGNVSALTGLNMRADTSLDCTTAGNCNALALAGNLDMRFGQLKLNNVFGSETSDLDMAVHTEYFDGTDFVLNSDDSCTVLLDTDPPLTASLLSYTKNLADGDTTPSLVSDISSGLGIIQFSAAGISNEGSVIFEYNTRSFLPWLNTENNNNSDYADNPFGKITFGQFRGTDRVIYWREIVR